MCLWIIVLNNCVKKWNEKENWKWKEKIEKHPTWERKREGKREKEKKSAKNKFKLHSDRVTQFLRGTLWSFKMDYEFGSN